VKAARPDAEFVALDFSPTMLETLRDRFAQDQKISVVTHDLLKPLPDLGKFAAVVSRFAIHHLPHVRKRSLYQEIFAMLVPDAFSVIWNMLLHRRSRCIASSWQSSTSCRKTRILRTSFSTCTRN
jgi:SAM-dependent methyltransferase